MADEKIERLLDWFQKNGGWLNPSVEIANNEEHGFHMRAKQNLQGPFDVVKCPLKLTLSHLNLDPNQKWVPYHRSPLQACLGKLPDRVVAYLLLIEQLVLGDDSPWAQYIDCLPDDKDFIYSTTKSYPNFETTALRNAKSKKLQDYEREHREALSVMAEVGISGSETYDECDFDTFLWAATIMSSRAFTSSNSIPSLPSFQILFPVVDIANHGVRSKTRWSYPDGSFSLQVHDDVDAGCEIYNNYGPKGNAELILGYGFAIEDNPVEQVPLKVRVPGDILANITEEHVPFGMGFESLKDEEGGLRTRDNILGRYNNSIPFFRGFPSPLVFASYSQALHAQGLDLLELPSSNLPGRLVLGTLLFLYSAIQDKCSPGLQKAPSHFRSAGERYAYIHLAGQHRICDEIRRELKAVLEKLRSHALTNKRVDGREELANTGKMTISSENMRNPTDSPVIVTLSEACAAYEFTFPDAYSSFVEGMRTLWQIDLKVTSSVTKGNAEERLWVFLLIVFASVHQDTNDGLIYSWMQDLLEMHPLEIADTDPNIRIQGRDSDDYDDYLVRLGRAHGGRWSEIASLEHRKKLVAWAVQVVHREVFAMPDHTDKSLTRFCMYMRPYQSDEKWMFEEVEPLKPEPMGELDSIRAFQHR